MDFVKTEKSTNETFIKRVKFLDGLKGFAAILLIGTNARFSGWFYGSISSDLFFLISAFLVTIHLHDKLCLLNKQPLVKILTANSNKIEI